MLFAQDETKPVFPANADGEAAKRKLLSTIADVASGDKRLRRSRGADTGIRPGR